MHVMKRNGRLEEVDVGKVVTSLKRYCDLPNVDVYRIATKTINGLVDNVSTLELDLLSVRTAKDLIIDDPVYAKVAARILANIIQKEVSGQDIQSFSQSIETGLQQGLIAKSTYDLVMNNKRKLNAAVKHERDWLLEYHGLQTVYDRYLLKHPTLLNADKTTGKKQRAVIETPQYFLMRVACGLANDAAEVVEMYNLLSSLEYMCSTPTLFNSGTTHSQMSSCFVAGTDVMTVNKGIQPIEAVAIGDLVVTHRGQAKPVTQLHRNDLGDRTLFNIKCFGSPQFTVTGNHRLWSISSEQENWGITKPTWNSVDYLRVGDWIALPYWNGEIKSEIIDIADLLHLFPGDGDGVTYKFTVGDDFIDTVSEWNRPDHLNGTPNMIAMRKQQSRINRFLTFDESMVRLLGVWYGDGSIMQSRNSSKRQVPSGVAFTLNTRDEDLIAFCQKLGSERFGLASVIHDADEQNCVQLQFHSRIIGHVFQNLFGRGYAGKVLPLSSFRWSRSLFNHFLAGLISSDGCVSAEGNITLAMANPVLMKSLYMVARNLGIAVTYRQGTKVSSNAQQAAINIPMTPSLTELIQKQYPDNRMKRFAAADRRSTSVREFDGVPYVRLMKKQMATERPEYVYTLGVEGDHSYSVEGLVCENCYLLDSPIDSLDDIYKRYGDIAMLSKFAGGIGVSMSRIRGKGSLIKGTNGHSDGMVPWTHTLSGSVAATNQGGRRKGAACVYLETHHPDIMQFLEMRDNTGNKESRAYNLNLANWVSDLFMKRVKADAIWSLFDPVTAPELNDLYGEAYERRYIELETEGKFTEQLPARKLYARMMRTLAENGNGWMCFKDTCNRRGNQVNDDAGTMLHLSNLCSEILEVTSSGKRIMMARDQIADLTSAAMIEQNINVIGFDTQIDRFEVLQGAEVAVCLAAGSQILTNDGYKLIEECDGANVMVPFENDYDFSDAPRFVRATLIDNGIQPVWQIRLSNGNSVCATSSHKFLIDCIGNTRDWVTVDGLDVGMQLTAFGVMHDDDSATVLSITPGGSEQVYDLYVPDAHHFIVAGIVSHNCNLGSINIGRGYIRNGKLDKEKLHRNVAIAVKYLDRVIDRNFYPIPEARASNMRWRPVGLGLMGLADFFFQMRIPFDSQQAVTLSSEIQEEIYYQALRTSCDLAKEFGPHRDFHLTRAAQGHLQMDLAGVSPKDPARWDALRLEIKEHGLRNSLLLAGAPTATISHICGVEETIEPIKSNLLKRETLSGEFVSMNKYLVEDLRKLGRWNAETISHLKSEQGNIATLPDLPSELYDLYKTVWEMSMKSLIAHAVARGAWIDQSHSLNMFVDLNKYPEDRRIGVLSSLYMHAWESGVKTTYYLRSKPATRIEQTTNRPAIPSLTTMAEETPVICESCQ